MAKITPNFESSHKMSSTWFFSCKTDEEQKLFEAFQRADISLKSFIAFMTMSSVVSFYFRMRLYQYNPSQLNLFSLIFGVLTEFLFGLLLITLTHYSRQSELLLKRNEWRIKVLGVSENLFTLFLTISRALLMITFIRNGHCPDSFDQYNIPNSQVCNSGSPHQMHEGLMALLLVYPMMISMIVKSVKSEMVFFCWAITFFTLLVFFVSHDFRLSLFTFIAMSLVSVLKLWELQRQKISMFFLSQELRGSQTENERLEKENRASELKHLIGNVAHDLKTVRYFMFCSFLIHNSLLCSSAPLFAEHGHRPDHRRSGGNECSFNLRANNY
jgi:hypothetical protein